MKKLTSALWRATLNGDYDRANELICSGANVNEPRNTEFNPVTTLLHYATLKKDVHRMRLLINHEANCNARDSMDRTPLHWAMSNKDCPGVIEVLIKAGATVDARSYYDYTPLLLAASNQMYQSAKKLIARGASIQAVNMDGTSALHLAVLSEDSSKDLRMTKMLIRHKVNINANDNQGYTALHCAVTNNVDIARLLLDNGARINEVNGAGNTALHVACTEGFEAVVVLLVKFGADVNVLNREGKTALQLLEPNRQSSEAIARIIIREAVKRESLGQHICENNRQMAQSCARYSEFDQKCREEIKRMRSEKIDVEDTAVSFFDIFTKNEEKLTALARNKNIVTAFEASNYMALFRIYDVDLTTKFGKAKRRASCLISLEDCLVDVLGDILPAPILQKIAAYVEDGNINENEL